MGKWTEIYRDRKKTREAWACKGCDTIAEGSHKHGAPRHLCNCDVHIADIGSKAYRDNYDRIFRKEKVGQVAEKSRDLGITAPTAGLDGKC